MIKNTVKSAKTQQKKTYVQKLTESRAARYDEFIGRDRYSSIDKLARDMGLSRTQVIGDVRELIRTGRIKNIELDVINGLIKYLDGSSHNHAYRHKVEPIGKATVVKNKIEAEQEAAKEENSNWDTDISDKLAEYRLENRKKKMSSSVQVRKNVGRNGDNGYMPQRDEVAMKCGYCGALNILPVHRSVKFTCYFCREEL